MPSIDPTTFSQAYLITACLLAGSQAYSASPEDLEWLNDLPADTRAINSRGLSDDAIPALSRFTDLNFLNFRTGWGAEDARITDVGLSRLAEIDLPNLRRLDLGYCQNITDAGLEHVAEIETLNLLFLMACDGITDQGLRHLAKMDHLETLDLRGCKGISDAGLEQLAAMTNLKFLRLGGCKNVSAQAVQKLQQALPGCNVDKNDREWAYHTAAQTQVFNPASLVIGGSIILVGFLSVIAYIPLQLFAVWKLKGGLRIAAFIPIPIMALVLAVTVAAYVAESNLWPIYMIFCSPIAVIFLAVLLIASRASTARKAESMA